jgi:hypothetical protein
VWVVGGVEDVTVAGGTLSTGQHASTSRFGRLSEAVAQLRTRAAGGRLDTWMLIIGGVLMPLGVLLIILGWVGASHTPLQFEQTPYLISGGVLGLGLVISGGFVYFGYWQTLRIRESREQSEALTAALARLESLLASGATTTGGNVGVTAGFVATPNGSIFHRPDCTVVAGRTDLTSVNPQRTKLEPCRICDPLG